MSKRMTATKAPPHSVGLIAVAVAGWVVAFGLLAALIVVVSKKKRVTKSPCPSVSMPAGDKDISSAVLARHFRSYAPFLEGKKGLEIGGPSMPMMGLGVYTAPASLDNANYSPATIWNKNEENAPYVFEGKTCPGVISIVDAVALSSRYAPNTYDFVFTSHTLEHLVNPLKALNEMSLITKPGGLALHVLPWKEGTFDHRRPITPFSELLQHFHEDRDESDVSDHMDEVRQYYDLERDKPAGTWTDFLHRCTKHKENRALHVHVFDFALLTQCLEFLGYKVLDTQLVEPYHQVILARKGA